jgi:ubiquinone/menaquinone biosynthesis C-methylase UbiE
MKKERLAEYYREHHATGRRDNFVFGGTERGALFSGWIGQGQRVLDLGCRDGVLTASFSSGNWVVGVDVDSEALERCRQNLDIEVHWLNLNEPLDFEDNSFDVIMAGEVLRGNYPE